MTTQVTDNIFKPGDMVEGFRVMAELGRGAASMIYLVQDPKTKHVWALKHVAKRTDKDQRFLDQAEAEYTLASKLDHPSIRKVERIIRKKEGLLSGVSELYLVMEHVDGASCERERPKTVEDAMWILEQTAGGLAAMHAMGYVHADMKPNNIIVDDKLSVKIIDLGQSCKVGTVKQRIQGTPDYIAPEQVHRRAITPKTDVYNLGAAMYWILTSTFVPTALGKQDSLVGSIDDSVMPKPKNVCELNPRVPEALGELVMQCVEIDPELRPTMASVTDKLNLIRSRLIAERALRKSGMLPKHDSRAGSKAGTKAGSKVSPIGPDLLAGSKVGNNGQLPEDSRSPRHPKSPPPIDPGPGIELDEDIAQHLDAINEGDNEIKDL